MRYLLAALAALVFAAPLSAAPSDWLQPFRESNRLKRVAVVWPSRWDAIGASNVNSQKRDLDECGFMQAVDMLRDRGIEVHYYQSEWFWRSSDAHNLWYQFGTYYPVTLLPGHPSETGSQVTAELFWKSESTTTKLIHFGGGSVSWSDSTDCGMRDFRFYWTHSTGACVPYANTADSLYHVSGGAMLRAVTLPAAISSVVRLFKPVPLVPGTVRAFLSTTLGDTSNVSATVPTDTTTTASEIVPMAWRIYRAAGGSVDCVMAPSANGHGQGVGDALYALAARHLDAKPIAVAVEFDDVFDQNPSNQARVSAEKMDSLLVYLQNRWGLRPTISLNPEHAEDYALGTDPRYENTWGASETPWQTLMRKHSLAWIHHAHDSTNSTGYHGNLVGRFGGYQPGNGSNTGAASGSNTALYTYGHRFASRNDPTNDTLQYRYGIRQRLEWMRSIRNTVCPTCPTPPYLSFCNNEVLPVDWKYRPTAQRTSWIGGRRGIIAGYADYPILPLDSLWWAFAEGVGSENGSTFYVRGIRQRTTQANTNIPSRPWGDIAVWGGHAGGDRDSALATTPFVFPDERTGSRINGRLTHVRCIATTDYDGGSSSTYRQNASLVRGLLFGTINNVQTGTNVGAAWGAATFTVDPNGIGQANTYNQRHVSVAQRVRMVYLHPNNPSWTNVVGPSRSYAIDVLECGLLRGIEALEAVAGKRLIRWVYPWEVYER